MMGKGARVARITRKEFNLDILNLDDLEILSFSLGAFLKYQSIDGAQGRIFKDGKGSKAIITVDNKITYLPKKKFVLAHEIGHFNLHKDITTFICDDRDLNDWVNKNRYEFEANDFAAELLMPSQILQEESKKEKLSFDFIKFLANKFQTSITATAIQYCNSGTEPCYIIYSESNTMKWFVKSEDIDLGYIGIGNKPPTNSVVSEYFRQDKKREDKEVVLTKDWFSNKYYPSNYLYEDCFYLDKYNGVLSLIWVCDDYD